MLTGKDNNRQQIVANYEQTEKIKPFLISIKAGGVGLNLTSANYVFIIDPWWNPFVEMQAIDRTHRIGQDKNVFVYRFISKNTIEEKILNLQQTKIRMSDDLIKKEISEKMEIKDLLKLI
jgi:SNF2 family DNA or RNA helicase